MRGLFLLAGLLSALVLSGAAGAEDAASTEAVEADGTAFVVRWGDGAMLRSPDLLGKVLTLAIGGRPVDLRIAAVEIDPDEESGTVWLHSFERRRPDGSWDNPCGAGPDGRRQGFPLRGKGGGIELTCTSGAIGKCVRFGYRPWADGPDGRPLAPLHAACVHLMRGDYGGTNEPWTRNGMVVDLHDDRGVQPPAEGDGWTFEAGWTEEGAVCVHHARVAENVTLAELERRYPRLAGRTGAVCTEEFARANGAILFNRSKD